MDPTGVMVLENMMKKMEFASEDCKMEIIEMCDEEFGWGFVSQYCDAQRKIDSLTPTMSLEKLAKTFQPDISPPGQAFSYVDFLYGTDNPGFCYLKAVEPRIHIKVIKMLGYFPTLHDITAFCSPVFKSFYITSVEKRGQTHFCHIERSGEGDGQHNINFDLWCPKCKARKYQSYWSRSCPEMHKRGCPDKDEQVSISIGNWSDLNVRIGGFFSKMTRTKSSGQRRPSSRKSITQSQDHEDKQVLNFRKSIKGDGIEPDMTRELYSVPKPSEIENMSDHIQNHKSGDIFPYVSVVGNEDETKEGRLARLRAYRSPYGKENRPEMRINGVILDELEGTILMKDIKDHVNDEKLDRQQTKQNKKFRPLSEMKFKKPYLQLGRITAEYVPLMSSTADYAELFFTLEDGRLLENCTIAQSVKLPTNQNGVFELSCDYCISITNIDQLSLKYFLSRPIMKTGFQWGSVSLSIRMSESDTPFMTPKVEAMAVVRAPFTTLEEHTKDPDHADIVFTSAQINKFREMYRAGEIMDIDEAKKERTKASSYSKSTIRGAVKGEAGPEHLSKQEGWEHLKGMVKPRLEEGVASVSAASEDEDDIQVSNVTRERWEEEQAAMRKQFESLGSDTTEDVSDSELRRSSSPYSERGMQSIDQVTPPPKSALKKARFEVPQEAPPSDDVYRFD